MISRLEDLDLFKGFLEGEEVDRFLEHFNIKFGSGTWVAGDFSDRFMRSGYNPDLSSDIISKILRIKKAGVRIFTPVNVEFLDQRLEIRWDLVDEVKRVSRENNMVSPALGADLSGVPLFKLGTLTNPDESLRKRSIEILVESLDIAKRLDAKILSLWPGQDGWDYSLESNYGRKIRLFLEGLRELAYEAVKRDLVLTIEAKLKEPREGNMIIPTTHAAILMARRVNDEIGRDVVGLTIDYGHELMYAVEPAYTVYLAREFNIPIHVIHINSAKTHSNDEDRIVGTGDLWHFIDFLYATIDTGFQGYYILDQFTYRMDPVESIRLSKEFFANIMRRVLEIYRRREEFEKIRSSGDQAKIIDFLKRIIL
ncbi:MAG: sugar phosphate isomerase/epimerase family protein [Sulfolobales archaeon]